jgi:hypothetical protein
MTTQTDKPDAKRVSNWKPALKLPITQKLLLSPPEQAAFLGISIRNLYLLEPKLPPVLMLGPKSPRRRRVDLEAWIADMQPTTEARPEPDQLRVARAKRRGAGTPGVGSSCGAAGRSSEAEDRRGAGQTFSPSNPSEVLE